MRKGFIRPLLLVYLLTIAISFASISFFADDAAGLVPAIYPDRPTNLTAAVSGSAVILNWTNTRGYPIKAEGFIVEELPPGGDWAEIGKISQPDATSFSTTVSQPGTYYFRVKSYNSLGSSSSDSVSLNYMAETIPPAAPGGLTAGYYNNYVNLQWTDNANNESGFRVEEMSPGGEWVTLDYPPNRIRCYFTKDQAGLYKYRVKAYNEFGDSAYTNEASVTAGTTITLQISSPDMTVNDEVSEIDPGRGTAPVISGDRTLLPLRAVVEALGGDISWDEKTGKVTIRVSRDTIELWIGSSTATVNDEQTELDTAPEVINGRTMLPVRFVAENLHAEVNWDAPNKVVTIQYISPLPLFE
jgi:hypothetical protein